MNLLRQLFTSKKFLAMLSGVIGVLILKLFKVNVDPATVAEIVGLVVSYILGQSIADQGKSAVQVQAVASLIAHPASTLTTTDEKIEAIKSV